MVAGATATPLWPGPFPGVRLARRQAWRHAAQHNIQLADIDAIYNQTSEVQSEAEISGHTRVYHNQAGPG